MNRTSAVLGVAVGLSCGIAAAQGPPAPESRTVYVTVTDKDGDTTYVNIPT